MLKHRIKTYKSFILIVTFFLFNLFVSCKNNSAPMTQQVLGTVCTINLYEQGNDNLYTLLFNRLNDLDNDFNINNPNSTLSKINSNAGIKAIQVNNDVWFVMQEALDFAKKSEGLFDPTLGPVIKLWGINTEHARVPRKEEIDVALNLTGYEKVQMKDEDNSIYLPVKDMALDLGGIVKGYAADQIVLMLKQHKIKRALIDLGGNIYVYGTKKDKNNWLVGIKNPEEPEGNPALVLSLQGNNTVVTSGVYERYFIQDGIRYHHIIDPRTGYPALSDCSSVSIITESSLQADALSTIFFILGTKALSFAEDDIQSVFISNSGQVQASKTLKDKLYPYGDKDIKIEFRE